MTKQSTTGVSASKNHQVSMSNALVRSAHNLSLAEKRIVALAISKINSTNLTEAEYLKKTAITITAADMKTIFGLAGKDVYDDMAGAAKRLYERQISYLKNIGPTASLVMARWVQAAEYNKGNGNLTLHFSVGEYGVFQYLAQLTGSFTTYKLAEVGGLRSLYSWRLYEVMKSYAAMGGTTIDLSDLHNYLETAETARNAFGEFKRSILLPAIAAVNEHTGLKVSFTEIKRGRSVVAISFTIKSAALQEATAARAKQRKAHKAEQRKAEKDAENWKFYIAKPVEIDEIPF